MFRELWLGLERDFIGKDRQEMLGFLLRVVLCAKWKRATILLTRGQLQSTKIPEEKWQQISIDFITDLPETSSGVDSIMTIIDKATRMTHVIPCNKTVTIAEIARLY